MMENLIYHCKCMVNHAFTKLSFTIMLLTLRMYLYPSNINSISALLFKAVIGRICPLKKKKIVF